MRVLLLSDINSAHTQKWARALSEQGVEVGIFSLSDPEELKKWDTSGISIFTSIKANQKTFSSSAFSKTVYFRAIPHLKKTIRIFKPDIVHSHYASSYGLLGALSKFKPFVVSVWGSDAMDFPKRSVINREILKFVFKKAQIIFATSNTLANHVKLYSHKQPIIIPFGINTDFFKPNTTLQKENTFTLGTVKSLENVYGIDTAIQSFSLFKERHPESPAKMLIIGDGSQKEALKDLSRKLNIDSLVDFCGYISPDKLPLFMNRLDVLLNLSQTESFGVSVIEASACKIPVIATATGGLKEVVEHEKTGFLVKYGNVQAIVDAIEKIYLNPGLRTEMGKNGRTKVCTEYDIKLNSLETIRHYKNLISDRNKP